MSLPTLFWGPDIASTSCTPKPQLSEPFWGGTGRAEASGAFAVKPWSAETPGQVQWSACRFSAPGGQVQPGQQEQEQGRQYYYYYYCHYDYQYYCHNNNCYYSC